MLTLKTSPGILGDVTIWSDLGRHIYESSADITVAVHFG